MFLPMGTQWIQWYSMERLIYFDYVPPGGKWMGER